MAYDVSKGFPTIVPQLTYRDVEAALGWLSDAFGFVEALRAPGPDGSVRWAEMAVGAGYLMLCAEDNSDAFKTRAHTVVFVPDVRTHHARAVSVSEFYVGRLDEKPEGLLEYSAIDLGGQMWTFSQHLRDVDPSVWNAIAT